AGAEFWPTKNVALRIGLDQDPATLSESIGNLTGGVGFKYSGFEFNYAYHTYSNINENTTHFFSISYLGEEKKNIGLVLVAPENDLVLNGDKVRVEGRLTKDIDDVCVKINGKNVAVDDQGKFKTDVKIEKLGTNKIKVVAESGDKKVVLERAVVKLRSFADVPADYFAKSAIEYLGTAVLMDDFSKGTFKPNQAVTFSELENILSKIDKERAQKIENLFSAHDCLTT
ncbi:MAG: S-layer homology domain-containing protein, partial [Candidatus Saganbacteria bacterium]|nr:S-layer homology domain-containing protein [Candidatus Saganbacteria bacterium]